MIPLYEKTGHSLSTQTRESFLYSKYQAFASSCTILLGSFRQNKTS